ncbi:hypothetical protein GWK47_030138 [Chionoecetes opilio]|uniref:Uncharacterized protein n=1 Tax=Chionoecetes opilio TaxID=41210 RepID=A0A8J4YXL1_CHIOP|nr:hypothetical protein GWK47_030138 [Chionoecetes opilio]
MWSPLLLISVVQVKVNLLPAPNTGRPSGAHDPARSPPTLHFQEPPPREPTRKRGKSENRPRPKSMITAEEVTRGAEWARSQRLGSTLSLNTEADLSESSSHSSLASVAAGGPAGGHAVRSKARQASTRRRQDSQGRRGAVSSSRVSARQAVVAKRPSLEAASESE